MSHRRLAAVATLLLLAGAGRADVIAKAAVPLYPGAPLPFWEVEQITDDIYGFRYSVYRAVFMVTGDGVIVMDPINARAAAILREQIRSVTDQPVRWVAYSHSHWDHASGGQIFKDEGATFVAQEQCAANLAESPNASVVPPDITFRDRYRISLGGKSVDMYFFGPSHDNCLVVMQLRPANMLFVVDIANPPSGWHLPYNPTFSEDRVWNMTRVLDATATLIRQEGIETLIGGHISTRVDPQKGRPVLIDGTTGPSAAIAERRDFLQTAIGTVRAQLAAGMAPADIPAKLVAENYLSERVAGYEPAKMTMLWQRMVNYVLTGE